ncbi:MAG: nitrogen regulatory protein 2 [Fusobacteriaceae bacterium]|jgi:nitrogen regulatory protein PII 2|nr:nitrogen regulatory protein [Fusobacteriales bacterium]MDN5304233.1 nitrogen regulatory protein 2 [Fusobacteriaceae bacterium]
MKEVMAIIRRNMINQTKSALTLAGINGITARKVLGRGKKKVNFELLKDIIEESEVDATVVDAVKETQTLITKRLLTIIVDDEDVKKVVDTIISVNQTGNPGDGKIFVMPIEDVIKVRTGETGKEAI